MKDEFILTWTEFRLFLCRLMFRWIWWTKTYLSYLMNKHNIWIKITFKTKIITRYATINVQKKYRKAKMMPNIVLHIVFSFKKQTSSLKKWNQKIQIIMFLLKILTSTMTIPMQFSLHKKIFNHFKILIN